MGTWTSTTARYAGWFTRAAVIAGIAASLLCAGCVLPRAAGKANVGPRPQHIVIGADTSGSMTAPKRRAAFGMVYLLVDQVLRPAPHVTIIAYDERVRLLFDALVS